jgi:NAD(P)H-flavin reductase
MAERTLFTPRLAQIVRKEQFTAKETFYEFRFRDGGELGHDPGQFAEVGIFGYGEAPISISSSPTRGPNFQMCVRTVGDVTSALAGLPVGSPVGIRGPFGRGFDLDALRGHDVLFVAGGLGLVPLRSLIVNVLDERPDFRRVILLYGARNPTEVLYRDEVEQWKGRADLEFFQTVDVADESWTGNVGVITTLFKHITLDRLNTIPVVVGPPIMFKFVVKEVLRKGIPEDRIMLSLERRMKCGVGKCGHCQINGVYVCQKGPVFSYAELKRLEEAKI